MWPFKRKQIPSPTPPKPSPITIVSIDKLDGADFIHILKELLTRCSYNNVEIVHGSNTFSIDLLADFGGRKYAFRGIVSDQLLNDNCLDSFEAGMEYYKCDVGCILTNSQFTLSARELSKHLKPDILLVERDVLELLLEKFGEIYYPEIYSITDQSTSTSTFDRENPPWELKK